MNTKPLSLIMLAAGLLLLIPESATAQARRAKPERGSVVRVLPRDNATIRVGNAPYHYRQGVFYRPDRSGYVVVRAPRGAVVQTLPRTYVTIRLGTHLYYYDEGTYYLPVDEGYRVVDPPIGATLDMPPVGYETVYVDGEPFYVYDDVWYRYDPGRDVYVVVEEP